MTRLLGRKFESSDSNDGGHQGVVPFLPKIQLRMFVFVLVFHTDMGWLRVREDLSGR